MTQPLPPEQFPAMLRRLRSARDLSRKELGRLCGVGFTTIRDLESGTTRSPHMRTTVSPLADALGLAGSERDDFIAAARAMPASRDTTGADTTGPDTTGDHVPGDPATRDHATAGGTTGDPATGGGATGGGATGDHAADGSQDAVADQGTGAGQHPAGPAFVQAPPRTIPYDVETFTGRDGELRKLADGAQRATQAGRTVVCVIEGMGGLGKTALAVHAAHLIIRQYPDAFPDAQLFINLRGYTHSMSAPTRNSALTANEALRSLLRQMGVPHTLIPAKQVHREALFRSTLAGKQALLILDNAKDAAQVRPLLPGSATCLVIVTTRDALHALDGTTVIRLSAPPQAEAIRLFTRVAGPDRIGPGGSTADDRDLAEIVRLCGYLPLAVQIVAARLRHRDAYTVAAILAELKEEHGGLSRMQDRDRGVRAAFQSSFRYLALAEKELFTQLALAPGMDVDAYAAASMSSRRIGETRAHLESLCDRHLLIQRAPDRYEFHDLVRRYAQEQRVPEAAEVTDRLLNFYLYMAQASDRLFDRGLPRAGNPVGGAVRPVARPVLETSEDAQAWLATELRNLIAAAEVAARSGRPRITVGVSVALCDFLRAHGPWPDALSLHQAAYDAAVEAADRAGQAGTLRSMGGVLSRMGEIAQSKEKFTAALAIYRELRDQRGTARTLIELGIAQRVDDETADSHDSLSEALRICQRTGDRQGQAAALTELASILWQTGPVSEAERHATDALEAFRDLGKRQGQAAALLYLGCIQQATGALDAAEKSLREAGRIGTELGQPILVANSLLYLGDVQREAGRLDRATESMDEAHKLYTDLEYRQGIPLTRSYQGRILIAMGDYAQADARLAEAIVLFEEIGDLSDKAEALNTRAEAARATGRDTVARGYYQEALELAIEASSSREQGAARLGLAVLDSESGDQASARAHAQAALALYEALGEDLPGAARAREILASLGDGGAYRN